MVAKKDNSATFEIIVVLAIVAIVAVTGQVLIYYESQSGQSTSLPSSNGLTGFVVNEETPTPGEFNDLAIESVKVLPESPLIGDPFEVVVTLSNKGKSQIATPFIVDLSFKPAGEDNLPPTTSSIMVPQIIESGKTTEVRFLVATIMPEGPLRIVSSADSTAKLKDDNPANNLLSKTIIVALD